MRILTALMAVLFVVTLLSAIGLKFLQDNPTQRAKLFSNVCKCMSDTVNKYCLCVTCVHMQSILGAHTRLTSQHSEEMMALRCGILADATGKVLEIGPGAGVNFQCLSSNSKISR